MAKLYKNIIIDTVNKISNNSMYPMHLSSSFFDCNVNGDNRDAERTCA